MAKCPPFLSSPPSTGLRLTSEGTDGDHHSISDCFLTAILTNNNSHRVHSSSPSWANPWPTFEEPYLNALASPSFERALSTLHNINTATNVYPTIQGCIRIRVSGSRMQV